MKQGWQQDHPAEKTIKYQPPAHRVESSDPRVVKSYCRTHIGRCVTQSTA